MKMHIIDKREAKTANFSIKSVLHNEISQAVHLTKIVIITHWKKQTKGKLCKFGSNKFYPNK